MCDFCESDTLEHVLLEDGAQTCRTCAADSFECCLYCAKLCPPSWLCECDHCGVTICHACLEEEHHCDWHGGTHQSGDPSSVSVPHWSPQQLPDIAEMQRNGADWWAARVLE
jgi:hypothetical protein